MLSKAQKHRAIKTLERLEQAAKEYKELLQAIELVCNNCGLGTYKGCKYSKEYCEDICSECGSPWV